MSVYATETGQEPVLLEGSPRAVPAGTPPGGELEAVTATQVSGWAVDDDYEGPITVALYVDGRFWRRVTADLARPDLEEQGAGRHGFAVDHALEPDQRVEAWAFGVRSGRLPRPAGGAAAWLAPDHPRRLPGPRVVHQAISDPSGPFAINLVTVDLVAPSRIDLALAQDALPRLETTSSMARRRGATVAVNGDYVDPAGAGRPIHAFALDGRLLQTAMLLGSNHAVDDQETAVFMGRRIVQVVAEAPRTGLSLPVVQVNRGAPAGDEVAMFTPEGATLEQPPAYAVEAVGQLGGPVPVGTVVLSTRPTAPPLPTWPRSSRATRSPWPGRSPPGRGSWRPAAATQPWSGTVGS